MPIRVVIKEVRYIHDLFATLEHSTPVSSPAAPGLTTAPRETKGGEERRRVGHRRASVSGHVGGEGCEWVRKKTRSAVYILGAIYQAELGFSKSERAWSFNWGRLLINIRLKKWRHFLRRTSYTARLQKSILRCCFFITASGDEKWLCRLITCINRGASK